MMRAYYLCVCYFPKSHFQDHFVNIYLQVHHCHSNYEERSSTGLFDHVFLIYSDISSAKCLSWAILLCHGGLFALFISKKGAKCSHTLHSKTSYQSILLYNAYCLF